jgi:hypothetical protein
MTGRRAGVSSIPFLVSRTPILAMPSRLSISNIILAKQFGI